MKLMQSMGWSEGEGLGRERQGMATPIILQKTDKRAGVIVNAEPLPKPLTVRPHSHCLSASTFPALLCPHRAKGTAVGTEAQSALKRHLDCMQGVQLTGAPSAVFLLTNMVVPGDVDDSLEDEVAGEAGKFGDVCRVVIFEVEAGAVPPDQAVRLSCFNLD